MKDFDEFFIKQVFLKQDVMIIVGNIMIGIYYFLQCFNYISKPCFYLYKTLFFTPILDIFLLSLSATITFSDMIPKLSKKQKTTYIKTLLKYTIPLIIIMALISTIMIAISLKTTYLNAYLGSCLFEIAYCIATSTAFNLILNIFFIYLLDFKR